MNLKLLPGNRHRILQDHPWVYSGEVDKMLPPSYDGQVVGCEDHRGRFHGVGVYNSKSQIIWRRISRHSIDFNDDVLGEKIRNAVARRPDDLFRRLVWADADELPGLIIDQYELVLVVQTLTLALDNRKDAIIAVLKDILNPEEILFRNDAPSRQFEGLPLVVETVSGEELSPAWYKIDGFDYFLDLQKGQKTGFYLDQRNQHKRMAEFARGRKVLDGFCHLGAFSFHCAKAGAREVVAVDISPDCIESAIRSLERNVYPVQFQQGNLFDYFTKNRDTSFDLIVLDPPSFARNRGALKGALRGYKELNLRALRLLTNKGILATYSCSQHVSREIFMETLSRAAADARRTVEIVEITSQPPDHPVILNFPESEYLKGAIVRVLN